MKERNTTLIRVKKSTHEELLKIAKERKTTVVQLVALLLKRGKRQVTSK